MWAVTYEKRELALNGGKKPQHWMVWDANIINGNDKKAQINLGSESDVNINIWRHKFVRPSFT